MAANAVRLVVLGDSPVCVVRQEPTTRISIKSVSNKQGLARSGRFLTKPMADNVQRDRLARTLNKVPQVTIYFWL